MIIIEAIIMFLAFFFLTLIDEVCILLFFKQPCRKTHHGHIPK